MSHFRVENARFRILKGGKIGLSLSIALASSLLTYPVDVNSQTFFNSTTTSNINAEFDNDRNSINANKITETDTSSSVNYTSNTSQDIIFKPNKVESSFVGVKNKDKDVISGSITTNSFETPTGIYYYDNYTPSSEFTITLQDGSIANNISKDSSTYSSVQSPNTYTTTSPDYIANIVLEGNNTIYGNTYLGTDGQIDIKGSSSFNGTINAESINIDTTNNSIFNSTVNLIDKLTFKQDGYVELKDNFKGDITSVSGSNYGTVSLTGNSNQIIDGTVSTIKQLNISNGTKVTALGDVNAINTNISSTLDLSSGKNINSTVAGNGNLNFLGNNIATKNIDLTNGNITTSGDVRFLENVKSGAFEVKSGTTTANARLESNITISNDATLESQNNIYGDINSNIQGSGTLIMSGSGNQTITGNIGNTSSLKDFKINSGTTTTTGNIKATNTTISNASKLNSLGDIVGNIGGLGTLELSSGATQIITGNISTATTDLKNSSTLQLSSGKQIDSNITNTQGIGNIILDGNNLIKQNVNIQGNVTLTSDATFEKNITAGSITGDTLKLNGNSLQNINATVNVNNITTGSSSTSTNVNFQDQVSADSLTISNNSTATLSSNATIDSVIVNQGTLELKNQISEKNSTPGNIHLADEGTLKLSPTNSANGVIVDSTITSAGQGTININGNSTFKQQVGTSSSTLGTIKDTSNATSTFEDKVFVENLQVNQGTFIFKDETTANNTTIDNGRLNIEDKFNGDISGTALTNGEVNFNATGNQTYSGEISNLKDVNINSNLTVNGKIESANTNINDGSTLKLNNSRVESSIKTNSDGQGNLQLSGTDTRISGDVGESNKKLNTVEALANSNTTINNNIFSNDIKLNSNSIINSSGSITANINGSANNSGTLNMSGSSLNPQTITGNIGNTNAIKDFNINSGITTLNGNLNAQNTNINDGSTLKLNNSRVESSIKTNSDGQGNLQLSGTDTRISGDVGESNKKLNTVEALANSNTTINNNIFSNDIKLNSNSIINSSGNITANINVSANNSGTLNMSGTSQNITGNIGNTNAIKDFKINSGTTTLNGNLNAQNTTIVQDAILNSKGDLKSNIQGDGILNLSKNGVQQLDGSINVANTNVGQNSTLQLKDGSNINSLLNGDGTLDILGSTTISKQVGSSTDKFGEIKTTTSSSNATFNDNVFVENVNVNSGTMTFEKDLNATTTTITNGTGNFNSLQTNLNFDGNGTAYLNQGIIGNINFAGNNATVNLNAGNVSGTISANGTNGKLNIAGTSTIYGTVGTDTLNRLNEISSTNSNSDATFKENVFANKVNVNSGAITFEKDLTATTTTIESGTGNFNTLNSSLNFTGNGTVNLNNGINGEIDFAGNDGTVNLNSGDITHDVKTTGTSGTLNIVGDTNVISKIGTDKNNRLKNINSAGSSTNVIFNDNVFAQNVNINNGNMKFEKELNADNVSIENGLGNFNKLDSNIVFNGNGTALLNDGIKGDITTTRNDQGILSLVGTKNQTIDGNIGEIDKKIKEFNINGGQIATVDGSINATDTNINNSSTLQLGDNQSINSTIKGDGTGILELLGSSTINQVIANLGDLKINADGSNSIFEKSVNSQNITSTGNGESEFKANITTENLNVNSGKITLKDISSATNTHIDLGTLNIEKELNGESIVFNDDGVLNLSDNANLNVENISSIDENKGTLNILENADIYSNINKINSINILGDEDKVVNFKNGIFSNLTSINSATVNFNQNSGNTKTNLLFLDNAVANLNGDLIGSINFQDTDAVVNVKDGKSIIGSVNSNINGTINYEGGGSLGKTIDENDSGNIVLGTLNVNTKNHQNKGGEIVPDDGLYIHRDIYADRINLQNNATLVLDNADLYALNDDKILIETDQDGQGDVIFNSSSIVNAQLAQNDKKLSSINAGNNGDKVVFNEDIFADRLNFLGDGNIVLNKEFDSLVDFKNKSGKLELADGINISEDGISFENANNATLKLNGDSTISRVLGDKNSGTSTFKNIEAGNSGKAVSFLEDIYIKDKLDIIGNGVVNLDGNLYSNLNFSEDGIVNIADGKSISKAITTNTDGKGNIIFEGETELNNNIGTKDYLLRNVVFGSLKEGDFNQKIDKDIYAQNTIIGNGENSSKISFDNNTKFGGNVYINNNSNLNINDNKIDIYGGLVLGENSQLNYKVHTDDLKGNAQESGNSGKITADSLALDKDTKFHIDYDGTWEGKGQYNLIETNNDILTNYIGNEKNGLVSDNSIIDSVIISDGTNLVLKADRTGGDDYRPEDLYIVKSEIGNDYSNGASQSLAGYANGSKREDALADIIRDLEYLEGGITITDEKKAQMIDIQRKLAPKANSATVQSAINVSKVSNEMVSSRIADIRRDIFEDRLAYAVDNSPTFTGYNSGDDYYYDVGDSTLWIKASYAKATQDAVKSYDGYKTKSYGATAGIDKVVGDDVIFGISASYFDTKVTQNRGDDDTKSYRGTIYGSSEFGLAYVDANVSFAHHETDSSREANSGKLSSKIKAQELSARVETGLNLPIDDGSYITPYVAVEHSIYKQKAYQEKGSKYQNDALKVDAVNLNTTSAEIGAKLTGRIELENALIIPHLRASVTNNFNHKNKDVKAQFVGGGSKFSTPHQDLHKTIYSVGTGIEARITNNSSIILDATYDRSKDGKYRAYGANVSFGLSF